MFQSNRNAPDLVAKIPGAAREAGAAGFMLIELLVAFTIAMLALGLLYRASSRGLDVGAVAGRYNSALLIAESTLDAIGVEAPLAPRESTRRVDDAYDQHLVVRPRPDLSLGSEFTVRAYPYEVLIAVTWHEGRRTRSIELKTIRLGPAP